jgi:hypothetical protein
MLWTLSSAAMLSSSSRFVQKLMLCDRKHNGVFAQSYKLARCRRVRIGSILFLSYGKFMPYVQRKFTYLCQTVYGVFTQSDISMRCREARRTKIGSILSYDNFMPYSTNSLICVRVCQQTLKITSRILVFIIVS